MSEDDQLALNNVILGAEPVQLDGREFDASSREPDMRQ